MRCSQFTQLHGRHISFARHHQPSSYLFWRFFQHRFTPLCLFRRQWHKCLFCSLFLPFLSKQQSCKETHSTFFFCMLSTCLYICSLYQFIPLCFFTLYINVNPISIQYTFTLLHNSSSTHHIFSLFLHTTYFLPLSTHIVVSPSLPTLFSCQALINRVTETHHPSTRIPPRTLLTCHTEISPHQNASQSTNIVHMQRQHALLYLTSCYIHYAPNPTTQRRLCMGPWRAHMS